MGQYSISDDRIVTPSHELEALAGRIRGLARVGLAASDTVLSVDLHQGGYSELFEEMADLSESMFPQIETLEQMAGIPIGGWSKAAQAQAPAATYAEWQGVHERLKAAVAKMDTNKPEPKAVTDLERKAEELCERIASTKPTSTADCAAILQWVMFERGQDLITDMHMTAEGHVAEYLASLQPKAA